MGLTIIKGTSQIECFKQGAKLLKPFLNNISTMVYVVVPDRASLTTELDLINNLDTHGLVNFDVITLNKLARMVLPDIDASTVGKTGMLVKIKQIINKNKDQFKIYNKFSKKNSKGFVDEIYETILQFKASNITPSDIENNLNKMPELLKLKMNDILIVYKDYENFLTDEIFDGASKFKSVIENIKFNVKIPKCVFWFAKAESYTNQAIEIINELIKNANEVYVSLCETKLTKFYSNLENVLTETAQLNFKKVEIKRAENMLSQTQNYLKSSLFNFGSKQITSENFKFVENINRAEELEFIATTIQLKVNSGEFKFSDFNIVMSNLEECEDEVKTILNKFNIPYNIDTQISAKDLCITKFIFNAFEVLKTHFKADKVLEFAKNALNFFDASTLSDFENYVIKYAIDGAMFIYPFKNESAECVRSYIYNLLNKFYEDFVKSENGENFLFLVLDFLKETNLEERVEKILNSLEQSGEYVTMQAIKECYIKIANIFDQIKIVVKNDELTINDFFDILSLSLNELKFNIIPVISDAVFVGDAFESYFSERKFLFLVDCNEKSFPRVKKDVGLIVDSEILNLGLSNKLSPSVSEVNERFLQRAYELMFFCENTYMCVANTINGESVRPSFLFKLAEKLFDKTSIEFYDKTKFVCKNQAYSYALNELNLASRGVMPSNPQLVSNLAKLFDIKLNKKEEIIKTQNFSELAFKNNTISVSQLETYATCPYKHFLRYILKLKPAEKCEIGSLDTGNIIHRFVELFLSKLDINKAKSNLKNYSQNLMKKVLSEKEFLDASTIKINEPIINNLINESEKIATTLLVHLENSNFKPISLEKKFDANTNIKINNLNLIGKVDRIDAYENMVRIIDYKTGSSTSFKISDIYYGTAIQLPLYSYILKEQGKNVVGMFYLLIRNKFDGKQIPKLNGVLVSDLDVAKNMDVNLKPGEKSSLLEIRLNADYSFNAQQKNSLVSVKEMNYLINSSVELASKIVDEIQGGNYKPSVLVDGVMPCDYCDYRNLATCKNCITRKQQNITRENFFDTLGEVQDEL